MKIRVYYEDTDVGGIVYHANYLKFCERARSELFFNSPLKPFSDESNFVVSSVNAKFLKPAKLGDLVLVKSEVLAIKHASVVLKQQIFSEKDELLFSADFVIAYLCRAKVAKLSGELVEFFRQNSNF